MDLSTHRFRKHILYAMLIAALAIILIVIFTAMRQEAPEPSSVGLPVFGKLAPDFTLPALDGGEVGLSQFRGQPVLINFWASWCVPCRDEMPEFVRAYEAHKSEGFVILGVNLTYSDSLTSVQSFASEFNVTFPILLDEEAIVAGKVFQIPGLPTSIFINRDGLIQRIHVGVLSGEQIDQYIAEILGK